jgi:glycosyltransferase involved in cell wall biosynthesis
VRVLHISTHDVAGGAARAAGRIHRGLIELGVDSSMLVAVRGGLGRNVSALRIGRRPGARLCRWMARKRRLADMARYQRKTLAGFERFSDDRTELGKDLVRQLPEADILHLHWIADLLDYREFFRRLPPARRLVWTLHDMNPFTGGCHYDADCGRFAGACGACPQLGSDDAGDLSRAVWTRKHESMATVRSDRMHLVAGSRWLEEEVRRSSLLGRFPVSTFHYGVDSRVFSPRDRAGARAALGIDPAAKVLLFVADSLENRRKGLKHLLAALSLLPEELPLCLVSIGRGMPADASPRPHVYLGHIDDDEKLAAAYSAADLFVIPSIQEAYGQTALEAMACGTPAVGFDTGGIREVIREGETGRLVRTRDSDALASAITSLLQAPALLARMREQCREIAVAEHSLRSEAERYLSLYRSLAQSTSS